MSSKRNNYIIVRFLALIVFLIYIIFTSSSLVVNAADLSNRRILLGSSFISEVTTHRFDFATVTAGNVGSIQFQYCSNSPLFIDPCNPPAGLDVSAASLTSQSGLTGFSISGVSSANNLVITRAPVAAAPIASSYTFSDVTNPSTADSVNYVRITVFDGIDGTGAVIDQGSVVFAVEGRFNLDAYVPPYLTFCVAVTVALDCSIVSGFLAEFGEFSVFSPATVTSQMSAATNDPSGYNIFMSGTTMTSGNNIITPLLVQTSSQAGVSQFGMNLRSNTNPSVGSNPDLGPVANGAPAPNYNTQNLFRFVNGDRVAGSTLSSGFNRYTASYIVNVSGAQPPGIYAATISYTAIASF